MNSCFDKMFLNDCTVTPAAVKQLRALFKFVRLSLSKLGYEVNQSDDIYYNTTLALTKFQRDHNLKETYCSPEVIKHILTQTLSQTDDPSLSIHGTGVDLRVDTTDDPLFGAIDQTNLDEIGKRFAMGVSRAVSQLTSPVVCITDVENAMLDLSQQASVGVKEVNAVSSVLVQKMNDVKRISIDVKEESQKALIRSENAEKALATLETISVNIEKKMEVVKKKLAYEMKVSNILVIILFVLIGIFIWQGFHNEKLEDIIKHKLPNNTET